MTSNTFLQNSFLRFFQKKYCILGVFFTIYIFFYIIYGIYNPTCALSQTILKGQISTVIEKGQVININLNTPVNFYFSQTGDNVTAFIPKDILLGNSYIPKGTRLEGIISNIKEPSHLGQDGAIEINFNNLVTPDNISIPIYATITSDTSSPREKVTKILTYDSALISYGTLHGAIAGIQYGGIPLAISSHGISLLAGAGVGTSFGIAGSFIRKGKIPSIAVSIPSEVALKSDFYVFGELPQLSAIASPSALPGSEYKGFRFNAPPKESEIEITVNNVKKERNKLFGEYLILEINLTNNSSKKISLADLVLSNKAEDIIIPPNLFLSGIESLKTVQAFDNIKTTLCFVADHKKNYELTLIDPLDNKEIVRVPLTEK